jgi:glucokinase
MLHIGIDLGGTNIAAGITRGGDKIIEKASVPTLGDRHPDEITRDIAELCKTLCDKAGVAFDEIESIGIAAPGGVDSTTGVVVYTPNLPYRNYPMAEKIREMTGKSKVCVANDANAAALGEAVAGVAKGTQNSVTITLGTGVGSGIIINGKIYTGKSGSAGELGHMVIEHNGRQCPCGRRGCFEAYSSATALVAFTRDEIEKCRVNNRETQMEQICDGDLTKVSARTAWLAEAAGDEAGKRVVDTYISYLADGIINIINAFDPEVVAIGGGVSNEKDNLLKRLVPIIYDKMFTKDSPDKVKIKICELGNDAGIVGAAALDS